MQYYTSIDYEYQAIDDVSYDRTWLLEGVKDNSQVQTVRICKRLRDYYRAQIEKMGLNRYKRNQGDVLYSLPLRFWELEFMSPCELVT